MCAGCAGTVQAAACMSATHVKAPARIPWLLLCRELILDIEDVSPSCLLGPTAAFSALLAHPGDAGALDYCIARFAMRHVACSCRNGAAIRRMLHLRCLAIPPGRAAAYALPEFQGLSLGEAFLAQEKRKRRYSVVAFRFPRRLERRRTGRSVHCCASRI